MALVVSVTKNGPIYDPDMERKMLSPGKISPEDLTKARESFAELETIAPRCQSILDPEQFSQMVSQKEVPDVLKLIEAQQALIFFGNMQKHLLSLPSMENLLFKGSMQSLTPDENQLLFLRFFKVFFNSARSQAFLLGEHKRVQQIMAEFSKISIHLIFPDDHFALLDDWMKEIVECQRLFRPFLPAVELEEGDSKGFFWTILKDNQLRGFLFCTMHGVNAKGAVAATRLCPDIYTRLTRCSVICTEIKLSEKSAMGESVENQLLEFARSYGIVNFGLDDEGREDNTNMELLMQWSIVRQSNITDEDVRRNPQLKFVKEAIENEREFQNRVGRAYREGNLEALIASLPPTQRNDVDKRRQDALIRKTHACLQSLEKAAVNGDQIPLGFFAYGAAHMLDKSYHKTVVQGLKELGYDIQFNS